MARPGASPPTGHGPAAALAEPVAGTLAHLGVRRGVAGLPAAGDRHRAARLHGLRPAVRPGPAHRRGVAAAAVLRLADPAVLVVPAHAGGARRPGPGPDPGRPGQAVVGRPAAVRLAAGPVDRPGARAGLAADAGGRDPVRAGHRRPQHPVRLRLRVQLLHRALLRSMGVHRRVRRARGHQAAADARQPALAIAAGRAADLVGRHPTRAARSRRPRGRRSRRADDQPARRAGAGRGRLAAGGGAQSRADPGRRHPRYGVAAAPRPDPRRRPQRLPGQPHRRRGGHHDGRRRARLATGARGRRTVTFRWTGSGCRR